MKPYELYSADDFIEDTDFRDWVQGHSERSSFWLSFLHRYPDKQTAFQQAERFIRAVHVAPEPIGEGQIRKEVERFIEISSTYIPRRGNGSSTFPPRKQKPKSGSRQWRTVVLGASVLFLSVLYWPVLMNRSELAHSQGVDHSITAGLVETTNNTKHLLRVVLTDGSEVMLSPKSGLRYPSRFTQKARIVYLKGEAVFAVKRQTKPFMVYTGEMVTKVLGTRFVVRAFDQDKKVTVQVLSGKVSVYREKSNESITNKKEVKGLILSTNQAAIFEKNDGNLTKTLVASPTLLTKPDHQASFTYDEVPLPVILHELEKAYGIPIQFDAQSFESANITAVLSNESLYEKLDLLCKAASASYEITDGQIVLSRKN